MFEIPFVSKEVLDINQEQRAKAQTARMIELTSFAEKLAAAGWPIEWTVTGLAFELPYQTKSGRESEQTPGAIRKKLAKMGIPDKFRTCSSRSLLEVVTTKAEYADRVRYVKADQSIRGIVSDDFWDCMDDQFIRDSLEEMIEIEELYDRKELLVDGDNQLATVKGRSEALDWLLGQDWPVLEQVDELAAEDAEEDREYARHEKAIDGLHAVLFWKQDIQASEPAQVQATPIAPENPAPKTTLELKAAEAVARLARKTLRADALAN